MSVFFNYLSSPEVFFCKIWNNTRNRNYICYAFLRNKLPYFFFRKKIAIRFSFFRSVIWKMLSLKSYFGICLLIYIDQLVKTATSQLLSKSCEYTGSILKIEDHILNTQADNLISRVLANQGALLLFRNKYMAYSMKKKFFFSISSSQQHAQTLTFYWISSSNAEMYWEPCQAPQMERFVTQKAPS